VKKPPRDSTIEPLQNARLAVQRKAIQTLGDTLSSPPYYMAKHKNHQTIMSEDIHNSHKNRKKHEFFLIISQSAEQIPIFKSRRTHVRRFPATLVCPPTRSARTKPIGSARCALENFASSD